MTAKLLESHFIKTCFWLVIIGTVWRGFTHFEIKDQIFIFLIFYPSLKQNPKITPKNQKFENLCAILKFYVDLGSERYLGRRYPTIGSMS